MPTTRPAEIVYNTPPPWDEASETAVLGSCFVDFDAISKVANHLKAADFYREKNQWVWAAMLKLYKDGKPTNQIIVAHALAGEGSKGISKLKAMGGAAYISYCIDQTPTSVHIKYYADIVKDCSERRQKLIRASQLVKEAYSPTHSPKRIGVKID